MVKIKVDLTTEVGKIKPMHGVGQPPAVAHIMDHLIYLKEAGIPYSRLHDVGGVYAQNRYVDIPNIFRDFNADENDPASYDFAFTDLLIEALMKNDCPPVYRLGVTIENACMIKSYRIDPPADYNKWARICEHIIRHYNEGWADGYRYGIRYWEIWNEPDNSDLKEHNQMWTGSMEDYFKLYDVTSKHLKKCFGDSISVGGFASCGFYAAVKNPGKYGLVGRSDIPEDKREVYFDTFFHEFFKYIKANNCPIDFFSWHSYASVENTEIMADYVELCLKKYGYENLETHLNEWNNANERVYMGTVTAAARYAAMMCAQQNKKTAVMNFYDARIGISQYGGLFNPITFKPFPAYYSFVAFNELYKLGTQVKCDVGCGELYAIAASDGKNCALYIANQSESDFEVSVDGMDIGKAFVIDSTHTYEEVGLTKESITVKKDSVWLIKFCQQPR